MSKPFLSLADHYCGNGDNPSVCNVTLYVPSIWGLELNFKHYKEVSITESLHDSHPVIMSNALALTRPILGRALVSPTRQGETHFLSIGTLMIRLAPTATKDN